MPRTLAAPRGCRALLSRVDPALGAVIRRVGPCAIPLGDEGHFAALQRSILFQQLSGKAASTIRQRMQARFGGRAPTPGELLAIPEDELRAAGVSGQKVASLRALARHVLDGSLPLEGIEALPDDEIIARVSQVRGLGRWSAEMFLLFQLGRLDVWPVDDLGVKKAIQRLHEHDELPRRALMEETGARYRPFCSIATWYLWRSLELPTR